MARGFERRARELSLLTYLGVYCSFGMIVGYSVVFLTMFSSNPAGDTIPSFALKLLIAFFATSLFLVPASISYGLPACLAAAALTSRLSRSVRGKFTRAIIGFMIGGAASFIWIALFAAAFQPKVYWEHHGLSDAFVDAARDRRGLILAGALAGLVSSPIAARRLMRKMRAELRARRTAPESA